MPRSKTFSRLSCAAALLAMLCTGAPVPAIAQAQGDSANVATPQVPANAEAKLAELAQKYAQVEASPAAATSALQSADMKLPDTPTAAEADRLPAHEQQPLGGQPQDRTDGGLAAPTGGWTLSTLAALGIVIALIFGARLAYQRLGGRVATRATAAVEVLSRTSVAPKNHVLLLRVGQRVLVVGDSATGLRTLANVDDPEEVAALLQAVTASHDQSFTQTFQGLTSRFSGDDDRRLALAEEGADHAEHSRDRTRNSLAGLAARLRNLAEPGSTAVRGDGA